MDVLNVVHTDDGQFVVVLVTRAQPPRYLPIAMGEAEATSIRMRLDRRAPPRPLTLNLLDTVLRRTGARITGVAIDDCREGLFLSTVQLRQARRAWDLDARPSDAIGLALGAQVPIWVDRAVLAETMVTAPAVPAVPTAAPPPHDAYEESL